MVLLSLYFIVFSKSADTEHLYDNLMTELVDNSYHLVYIYDGSVL